MKHTFCISLILTLLLLPAVSSAQSSTARKETRKGNREYRAERYDKAEMNYRRALHDDSTSYRAHYNLGNSLYRQAISRPDWKKKTAPKEWTNSNKP